MKKVVLSFFVILFAYSLSFSQSEIDGIVAIVGNEIILKSEVESQTIQLMSQATKPETADVKCTVLEDILFQKLLYQKALRDSVEVSEKEVEQEINRRLAYFINQLGSESKLEEYYGKPLKELKETFRTTIREQLLTQRVQAGITSKIKVTPSQVKEFYNNIPADSIPMIESYFELSEIVFEPVLSQEQKNETINKLNDIRDRILKGENFATLAVLYSEDPGSAVKGGELGFLSRTDLVPEFAAVAFNLTSTNEISRVVETDFGYHIIQLVEKKGNLLNLRHILIKPKVAVEEIQTAENKALEVYDLLIKDSISFEDAVKKYSNGDTRFNNGKIVNEYYGNSKLSNEFIDMPTRKAIVNLKENEISLPFLSSGRSSSSQIKIVRLDEKVDKHLANLKDDYQEIYQFALQVESQKLLTEWISKNIGNTYIKIVDSYKNCAFEFADWGANSK